MSRYVVQVAWGEPVENTVTRSIEYVEGHLIGPPLAPDFTKAIEAILQAHHGSGHEGKPLTIDLVPR